MGTVTDKRRWVRILGAITVLCFVVDQWLVPLHLALHAHCVRRGEASVVALAAHAHGAHGHDHHQDGEDSDEAPHPVEDHVDEGNDPDFLSSFEPLIRAPHDLGRAWFGPPTPRGNRQIAPVVAPRAPPPPDRCAPRAPPVCV